LVGVEEQRCVLQEQQRLTLQNARQKQCRDVQRATKLCQNDIANVIIVAKKVIGE
jgi:hypothetical protein